MDIHLLIEEWEHVLEVEEVVSEWAFHIVRCSTVLKIKVVKTTNPPDMYVGLVNFEIQNSDQAGPYMSIYPKDTIKEALEDALRGFLMWYDPEQAEENAYIRVEDW